eukprot:6189768-Pleurochrysis_carterae.AAC.3
MHVFDRADGHASKPLGRMSAAVLVFLGKSFTVSFRPSELLISSVVCGLEAGRASVIDRFGFPVPMHRVAAATRGRH